MTAFYAFLAGVVVAWDRDLPRHRHRPEATLMPGRTLRDAIAVALEAVPSVELAAGDELSRSALHGFLLAWVKEYAYQRGVIFEDGDLEAELAEVIGELRDAKVALPRTSTERGVAPAPTRAVDPLEITCRACNAKPGERCGSFHSLTTREPHAWRVEDAKRTT